jgi:cytochrome b pre-mRNA-processing protein 3
MLGFLFRTLTTDTRGAAALFDSITTKAREPHWYVEGAVPDTIDGRFAVLTTIASLVIVHLEQLGEAGHAASVALTERFIEVMESEHRELGLGDPTLGKTVRKLVGLLARRTELWRSAAIAADRSWTEAARDSLYHEGVSTEALMHSSDALRATWAKLHGAHLAQLQEGKLQ